MFTEITNDKQYYHYATQYDNAQINIGLAYNEIRNMSTGSVERLIELQDYVNTYKTISEGLFFLLSQYTAKKEAKKTRIHIVDANDNLATISAIYYSGDPYKWEQIYIANNLTSLDLTVGQELIIPNDDKTIKNPIRYSAGIMARDIVNIQNGLDKLDNRS